MKRFFSLAICLIAAFGCASAQNVQLHYDLGHSLCKDLNSRTSVTTTVEMFKPDTWGSTFMFTDIDYKSDGVMGAYWEIAREFNLSKNKQWAAHVEYNGGLGSGKTLDSYYGNRYQHAVLLGGAWNWASKDFSGLCTFSGFCDLWYDPNVNGKMILLSEPQFWFNLNTLKGMKDVNLSLGTEVEISNNFVWNDKGQNNHFYAIPTVAAKWTF